MGPTVCVNEKEAEKEACDDKTSEIRYEITPLHFPGVSPVIFRAGCVCARISDIGYTHHLNLAAQQAYAGSWCDVLHLLGIYCIYVLLDQLQNPLTPSRGQL